MKRSASFRRRLLSLPGLRKYGERLDMLERRAADLKRRLSASRAALDAERITRRETAQDLARTRDALRAARRETQQKVDALHAKIDRFRSRVIRAEPLEQLLPARHQALRQSDNTAAVARAAAFAATSDSYALARRIDAPLPGASVAECYGMSIRFPTSEHDSGSLSARLRRGWLPLTEIAAIRTAALGPVMLDIGANVGTTALPRVVLGDAQMVLAAEPDPANYACLVSNVIANGLEGLVLPDRVALSDHDGESAFVRGGHMGTHHLTDGAARDGDGTVRVPTMTLDSWLVKHGVDARSVGFVKVDTQGWEPRVLSGAPSLLTRRHVVWEVELHPGLVSRSGVTTADFLQMLATTFTSFIDLRGTENKLRPTRELVEALDYLVVRGEKTYTDLMLFRTEADS